MAIFAIVGGLALFVSFDTYRGYAFQNEVNTVVGLLAKARSRSMANIDAKTHGVEIFTNRYVVFEGPTYDPMSSLNEVTPTDTNILHSGDSAPLLTEVVFDQLDGKATLTPATGNLKLTMNAHSVTFNINPEGRIDW